MNCFRESPNNQLRIVKKRKADFVSAGLVASPVVTERCCGPR
jgi:hypothetical protein